MNRKTTWISLAIVALVLLYFLFDYASAFNEYNKLKEEANSPVLEPVAMGIQEEKFIQDVQNSWTVFDADLGDRGLIEMCQLMGFKSTTSDLVDCMTHKIPPFDLFDKQKNLIEAGRAGALSTIESISVDGKVYYRDGVAYIRPHDRIVEYYEDTAEGIRITRYGRSSDKPNKM